MKRVDLIRIGVFLALVAFLFYIQQILYPIIIALVLYYILSPLARSLSKKMGPSLAAGLSLVIFFLAVIIFFSFIIPPFAGEFSNLINQLPQYIETVKDIFQKIGIWRQGIPEPISNILSNGVENILNFMVDFAQKAAVALISVLSQFINLIIIPMIAFYLLKDASSISRGLRDLLPQEHREVFARITLQISQVLNNYVRGVSLLCLIVGTACGLGLYLIGMKYYLILGAIATVTEFIPIIGPFLGAVPAVIVAFWVSPLAALKVVILYLAIQMVENSVLAPKIIGKKLNLHPLTIIISILVLGKLIGAWGLFFAAPIAAILKVFYLELFLRKK